MTVQYAQCTVHSHKAGVDVIWIRFQYSFSKRRARDEFEHILSILKIYIYACTYIYLKSNWSRGLTLASRKLVFPSSKPVRSFTVTVLHSFTHIREALSASQRRYVKTASNERTNESSCLLAGTKWAKSRYTACSVYYSIDGSQILTFSVLLHKPLSLFYT